MLTNRNVGASSLKACLSHTIFRIKREEFVSVNG
jgi:hypothetical protein